MTTTTSKAASTADPAGSPGTGPADIAWMRALAQEGATEPLQGGAILLAAGLTFGTASVLHWLTMTGLAPWPMAAVNVIWPAITLVFVVFATIEGYRARGKAGVRTAANRASATVWTSVGIGIFTLFLSMMLIGLRQGGEAGRMALWLVPSIIMVFYGLGWAVSATMMRSALLWRLSVASFVAAPGLAAFTGSPWQYLLYAACLFGLMALPGWLLMKKARVAPGVA